MVSAIPESEVSTEFRTTDLGIAAYLAAGQHLDLLQIETDSGGRAVFVFEDPQNRGQELAVAYLTRDAVVPGARFHHQLRALRRMLEQRRPMRAAISAV